MLNILLTGIGGQGTVLAAKVLAQAAQHKGWEVRTAETIGMAQRGGSVVSHVRMGNKGEKVYEPLLAQKTAHLIIAFEPAEAVRVLPYLAPGGVVISAASAVQPVSAALAEKGYEGEEMVRYLSQTLPHCVIVDDKALTDRVGNKKVLNMMLVAIALQAAACLPERESGITIEDLKQAVSRCVKEQFVSLNLTAIDYAVSEESKNLIFAHKVL